MQSGMPGAGAPVELGPSAIWPLVGAMNAVSSRGKSYHVAAA